MFPLPPRRPARPRVAPLTIALALAAAGLAGCDEPPPTSPPTPMSAGASANRAAADSLGATATRRPGSFFVDPRLGNDANPGTKNKPFKTLAHALALAIAGDTMRLASGTYSAASGEKFTNATQQVLVPAGVVILGTQAGDFTSHLQGTAGETGLNLKGSATVRDVVLSDFTTGIRATQGVQSLRGLLLKQNALGLDLSGSAKTEFVGTVVLPPSGVGLLAGARVRQQAQFILDQGGTITAGFPNCSLGPRGVDLGDAGQVTLKNFTRINNIAGNALRMAQTSKALLTSSATITRDFSTLPGGCAPLPSVTTLDSASLTLRRASIESIGGTNSVGILSLSRAPLTLDTAKLVGHTGASLRAQGSFKLVANASVFNSSSIGIDAISTTNPSITITGSTVRGNGIGIRAPFFRLRRSEVTFNRIGILLTGPFTDLGQPNDPGNNVIRSSTVTGVTFDANVVNRGVGAINASGNQWIPGEQGADGNGLYPDKPTFDGLDPQASGKNFMLPKSTNFLIAL